MLFTRRLRRHPLVWWALVVTVAGLTGFLVTASVASAQSSAKRFGGLTTVAVFTKALGEGAVVAEGDVRSEARPSAFLPQVDAVLDPVGRTVKQVVVAGDVATLNNSGHAGESPTAALLDDDELAIPLPLQGVRPELRIGDRLDVLATFARSETAAEPVVTVGRAARVVQLRPETVMVAVSKEDAPKVAHAATQAKVVLALRNG